MTTPSAPLQLIFLFQVSNPDECVDGSLEGGKLNDNKMVALDEASSYVITCKKKIHLP